jgi:two-component system LytT family response regulator
VGIADDELLARKRIARLLDALPGVDVVLECTSGAEVLEAVASEPLDALFLDVHMPGLLGTEVAGLLGDDGPRIVFLTAHPDHAVDAFEAGAVDYLLKPAEAGRVAKAVERVRERLALGASDPTPANTPIDAGRFALPTPNGAVLIALDALSHAVIEGASVAVHVQGERPRYTDLGLAELERRLSGATFLRVHRQALVNLTHITRLEDADTGGYLAHLRDGSVVAVSRAAARRLRKAWGL